MTDTLCDLAEFTSSSFRPFLPEGSQVNPEVYGAELAFWLSSELAKRTVFTSYPEHEDWGWYIEYRTADGSEFAVHCSNVRGTPDRWALQLRRFGRKLFGRDKPPFSDAGALVEAVQATLNESPVASEIDWKYRHDQT